ncbi:hypothetical protein LEP3755_45690 [Leptolyngbya sp. NIES-3755]|nr:hypothetical protein LEP3755_45690 [Leptolyngbya sp. NIES-3755]
MQPVSRSDVLYVIDHCWMVEDPREDEYAYQFLQIQDRHRVQFEQALECADENQYEVVKQHLDTIREERDRAEEILYWLFLDSELRRQGKTVPDLWEEKVG